jgi:hypothetical protein
MNEADDFRHFIDNGQPCAVRRQARLHNGIVETQIKGRPPPEKSENRS